MERTGAQPPEELSGLRLGPRKTVAAGVGAVASSGRHMLPATGPVRMLKLLSEANQKDGFDCPSCAWPDPKDDRSFAEFCENGAKAIADAATTERCGPEFFAQWRVDDLTEQTDKWLNDQGRLTHPMVRRPRSQHYEPISWTDAARLVAQHLNSLGSPDEAVFYTSGRTSNEAAFLYQLFVRAYGTNNLPDCSNMCHESSGSALGATIGIGKGTVLLEDFDVADAIVIIGQNPGTNHPRMLTALQKAKANGATIVAINPLPEAGFVAVRNPQDFTKPTKALQALAGRPTKLTDLFVPVRVGGDLALLTGIQKALLEREAAAPGTVVDGSFVASRTAGFDDLVAHLDGLPWDLLVQESGIDRARIEAVADVIATNDRVIYTWAMGITQHEHAVGTIQQVVNLALLRGSIGKPGAGLCPVRGHSNVQGDRTVGIWERPPPEFLEALGSRFDFAPPREHGLDTVSAIQSMHRGEARVFIGMGGNFLSATPDTEHTAQALRRCALTVQVSTKLNRSHLVTGETALILPCLARTDRDVQADGEQFVSVENSMGIVHSSKGRAEPPSPECRSEPAIVALLAHATLGADPAIDWHGMVDDYDRIRDGIEAVIPGFEDYNQRVREPGGFELPNGPRHGEFTTPDGLAHFTAYDVPSTELADGELLLMTMRSHDQFNTTIYGNNDRYRGVHNERRVVFLNERDLRDRGLATGDVVDITSTYDGVQRVARRFVAVAYDIPVGCAGAYFPEANVLVPVTEVARTSNTPASKSIRVTLTPVGERVRC